MAALNTPRSLAGSLESLEDKEATLKDGQANFRNRLHRIKLTQNHLRLVEEGSPESQATIYVMRIENVYAATIHNKVDVRVDFIRRRDDDSKPSKHHIHFSALSEQEAREWRDAIVCVIQGRDIGEGPVKRKFLVIINPFGGTKSATKIWKTRAEPLFLQAGCDVEVISTTEAGHARRIGKTFDAKAYDAIATVSGDGLIHEMINGIMEREDRDEALKVPLATIPGGSSNAFAKCLDALQPEVAAVNIIQCRTRPFDLCKVRVGDRSYYSHLMTTFGLVSDIDLESDRYRWVGPARFTMAGLLRMARLRAYPGTLQYLPARSESEATRPSNQEEIEREIDEAGESAWIEIDASSPITASNAKTELPSKQEVKVETSTDAKDNQQTENSEKGNQDLKPDEKKNDTSKDDAEKPDGESKPEEENKEDEKKPEEEPKAEISGVEKKESNSTVGVALPTAETTGSNKFGFTIVMCMNVVYCAPDFPSAPFAEFDDGCVDLVWHRIGGEPDAPSTGRDILLPWFLDTATHAHVPDRRTGYVKARAVRCKLTGGGPRGFHGARSPHIDVDGEPTGWDDWEVRVLPRRMLIVAPTRLGTGALFDWRNGRGLEELREKAEKKK